MKEFADSTPQVTPQEAQNIVEYVEERIDNRHRAEPYDPTCGLTPEDVERYLNAFITLDRPYHSSRGYILDHIVSSAFPVEVWRDVVLRILDGCERIEEGRFYTPWNSTYSIPQPDGTRKEINRYNPSFEIINRVCDRRPEFFADSLDKLFSVGIEFYTPTNRIMWERYGARHQSFLNDYLYSTSLTWEWERTLVRLLWINTPETRADVKKFFAHLPEGEDKKWLSTAIIEGGSIYHKGELMPLYPQKPYHLIFPKGYLTEPRLDEEPSFQPIAPHPEEFAFGGQVEGMTTTGRDILLDHIITFDPIPDNLPVTGLQRLTIAFSLSAVHYDGTENYYHHTAGGLVIADEEELEEKALKEALPLKPTRVFLSDQGEEYRIQGWESDKNLYRVGGPPSQVQGLSYPNCKKCGELMPHIMQLDSSLPQTDGIVNWWGSGGLAHINWCDRCKISCIWTEWT